MMKRLNESALERLEKLARIAVDPNPGLIISCRVSGEELLALVEEVKEYRALSTTKAPKPPPDVFRDLTNEQRKAIEGAVVLAIPEVPEILRGTRYATQDETGQWIFTPALLEDWRVLCDAEHRFNRNGEIISDKAFRDEWFRR